MSGWNTPICGLMALAFVSISWGCSSGSSAPCHPEDQPSFSDAAVDGDAYEPWPPDAKLDDASCERACRGNPCFLGMVNNQRTIFCVGDAQTTVIICPG